MQGRSMEFRGLKSIIHGERLKLVVFIRLQKTVGINNKSSNTQKVTEVRNRVKSFPSLR